MNIAVDPSFRRRGLAVALLEELFVRAGRDRAYTLEVRTSNGPAIALYEKFGFRAAGVRKRYYQDTNEDALIMWRLGEQSPAPR
jgi:ribosomal-protein-alanine N-acetyltransferase